MKRPSLTALFAATALVAAPAAFANDQSHNVEKTVSVDVGDLDLSTERGTQTAERRIKSAARQVCGRIDAHSSVSYRREIKACTDDAIENAMLNLKAVVAERQSQNGKG